MNKIISNDNRSLEKRKQMLSSKIQKLEQNLKQFKYTKDKEIVN